MQDFLSCILDIPLAEFEDCVLLDKELKKDAKEDKSGILDIQICLKNGTRIDMEMQFIWDDTFILRSIFYIAKMYTEDFPSGTPYSELHKCININIVGKG